MERKFSNGCDHGRTCPSSFSRSYRTKTKRFGCSSPGRTITWSNRSAWPNCSRAAKRPYDAISRPQPRSPVVVTGPLSIDLVGRTVSLDKNQIRLTRKEYRLLHILATHVGLVVTHDHLLREIWTGNQRDNIQYLRILVRKLRQKIESDPNSPRLLVTRVRRRLSPSGPTLNTIGRADGPPCQNSPFH